MNIQKIREMETQLAQAANVDETSVKLHFFKASDNVFLIHRKNFEDNDSYSDALCDITFELEENGKFLVSVLIEPEVFSG